ncbi:MAG: hypothetical protein J6N54_03160 [Bacteroidales bacterium]|nr:hypothetical protein [Bacteroidales bacterium]
MAVKKNLNRDVPSPDSPAREFLLGLMQHPVKDSYGRSSDEILGAVVSSSRSRSLEPFRDALVDRPAGSRGQGEDRRVEPYLGPSVSVNPEVFLDALGASSEKAQAYLRFLYLKESGSVPEKDLPRYMEPVVGESGVKVLSLLQSMESPEERMNLMTSVLFHVGNGQVVDDFLLIHDQSDLNDSESLSLFLDYCSDSQVKFDRVHVIDDRYMGFNTEHFVYPYVGGGTKEFTIQGVCVTDVRQGVDISRMADVGLGDDSTLVYAGRDSEVDGRRISALHRELLPAYGGDEAAVLKALCKTEETMYPVYTTKQGPLAESRFVGRAIAALDDWHPNLMPSADLEAGKRIVATAVYKAWNESLGLDKAERKTKKSNLSM